MEDSVTTVTDELSAEWDNTNTDSKTPTIGPVEDYKRIDVREGDWAVAYALSHEEMPKSLGYTHIDYTDVVSVDVRTAVSRAHLIKMRDEVRRILYAKRTNLNGYKDVRIGNITDLSDKFRLMWRMTIDVRLWKVITAVPS